MQEMRGRIAIYHENISHCKMKNLFYQDWKKLNLKLRKKNWKQFRANKWYKTDIQVMHRHIVTKWKYKSFQNEKYISIKIKRDFFFFLVRNNFVQIMLFLWIYSEIYFFTSCMVLIFSRGSTIIIYSCLFNIMAFKIFNFFSTLQLLSSLTWKPPQPCWFKISNVVIWQDKVILVVVCINELGELIFSHSSLLHPSDSLMGNLWLLA